MNPLRTMPKEVAGGSLGRVIPGRNKRPSSSFGPRDRGLPSSRFSTDRKEPE